jgi:hypothetical protein
MKLSTVANPPCPETFSRVPDFGKVKKSNHPLHSVKLK